MIQINSKWFVATHAFKNTMRILDSYCRIWDFNDCQDGASGGCCNSSVVSAVTSLAEDGDVIFHGRSITFFPRYDCLICMLWRTVISSKHTINCALSVQILAFKKMFLICVYWASEYEKYLLQTSWNYCTIHRMSGLKNEQKHFILLFK